MIERDSNQRGKQAERRSHVGVFLPADFDHFIMDHRARRRPPIANRYGLRSVAADLTQYVANSRQATQRNRAQYSLQSREILIIVFAYRDNQFPETQCDQLGIIDRAQAPIAMLEGHRPRRMSPHFPGTT